MPVTGRQVEIELTSAPGVYRMLAPDGSVL